MPIEDKGIIRPINSRGREPCDAMFKIKYVLFPVGKPHVVIWRDEEGNRYVANILTRLELDSELDKDGFLLTNETKWRELDNSKNIMEKKGGLDEYA